VLPSRRLSLGGLTKPSPRDVALGQRAWAGSLIPDAAIIQSISKSETARPFSSRSQQRRRAKNSSRPSMALPIGRVRNR